MGPPPKVAGGGVQFPIQFGAISYPLYSAVFCSVTIPEDTLHIICKTMGFFAANPVVIPSVFRRGGRSMRTTEARECLRLSHQPGGACCPPLASILTSKLPTLHLLFALQWWHSTW